MQAAQSCASWQLTLQTDVQKERVAAVVEVLGEAEGQIRIEDVLPLFPDFVTIDAFKAAICASLEDYNAQIEGLKTEMADSTRIADALRCGLNHTCWPAMWIST